VSYGHSAATDQSVKEWTWSEDLTEDDLYWIEADLPLPAAEVVMTSLRFRPGFDVTLLQWGAPDQPVSNECSCCDAPILEEDCPLRIWNDEGWALVLCDDCVAEFVVASS
jgi:hypothetical protein